ncbi:MAG: Rab family GTPase [Candidatus Kariarchaeaceae archaeon]|jgi:small GTP-binding protein
MSEAVDLQIKVLLLGNGMVGKTSLATRFAHNTFKSSYQPSIGVDFLIKILDFEGRKVKVLIFDTAGQEFLSTLRRQHYGGASGAAIVFDLTSRKSFEDLTNWVQELREEVPDVKIVFVGNKTDLIEERVISADEAKTYAKKMNGEYLESSAKLDYHVTDIFIPFGNEALSAEGI